MPDATDIILKQLEQQWTQARQAETQRALVTQFALVLTAAMQGFIVQLQFNPVSMGLALIIVFLGIYGSIICAKYYERFRLHVCRIGRLMEWLEQNHPTATLSQLESTADNKHKSRHPYMYDIRLSTLWQILHWSIVLGGLIDIVVICCKWHGSCPAN